MLSIMRCGVKYYSIEIIQGLGVGGDILLQEASLECCVSVYAPQCPCNAVLNNYDAKSQGQ